MTEEKNNVFDFEYEKIISDISSILSGFEKENDSNKNTLQHVNTLIKYVFTLNGAAIVAITTMFTKIFTDFPYLSLFVLGGVILFAIGIILCIFASKNMIEREKLILNKILSEQNIEKLGKLVIINCKEIMEEKKEISAIHTEIIRLGFSFQAASFSTKFQNMVSKKEKTITEMRLNEEQFNKKYEAYKVKYAKSINLFSDKITFGFLGFIFGIFIIIASLGYEAYNKSQEKESVNSYKSQLSLQTNTGVCLIPIK